MATAPLQKSLPSMPEGCTFSNNDWAVLARHWFPVAVAQDVTAAPLKAKLLDQPLEIRGQYTYLL